MRNWILPPLSSSELDQHRERAKVAGAHNDSLHHQFSVKRFAPATRPQLDDRLFVRTNKEIVGWHRVLGVNRAFDQASLLSTERPIGWQVLYDAEFHELVDGPPPPNHINFAQYDPPHIP